MTVGGPDSRSSWMVAAACCFINMMMYGLNRLSGVLFVASVSRFQVSRQQASFPYTFTRFIRNTGGPLVGFLGHKLGVRFVTTLGCFLAAIGAGTCFFAENINTITVTWGVIFGFGCGLGSALLPVKINQYFDKYRATASGISFSGACLGSFILPPIVEVLLETYGLSGTFLILAGIILNCVPAALFLREPEFQIKSPKPQINKDSSNGQRQSIITENTMELNPVECGTFTKNLKQDSVFFAKLDDGNLSDSHTTALSHSPVLPKTNVGYVSKSFNESRVNNAFIKDKDSSKNNVTEKTSAPCNSSDQRKSTLNSFSVIFDPFFLLVAITNALYRFSFVCMAIVIVDFARDLNVGFFYEKYVLMSLSIGDFVGRLGFGWVTDNRYLTTTNFVVLSYLCQGVIVVVMAWSTGFIMLVTLTALYGFAQAGLMVIFPIIIAQFIEKDKQTVAIPSSEFLAGPLCLTIPLLIGFFRDQVGSYDYIFFGIGILSALCGMAWLVSPFILKCRKCKE